MNISMILIMIYVYIQGVWVFAGDICVYKVYESLQSFSTKEPLPFNVTYTGVGHCDFANL